jgi:hypothetical protein
VSDDPRPRLDRDDDDVEFGDTEDEDAVDAEDDESPDPA